MLKRNLVHLHSAVLDYYYLILLSAVLLYSLDPFRQHRHQNTKTAGSPIIVTFSTSLAVRPDHLSDVSGPHAARNPFVDPAG